jgi:hypothetical protein
MTENSDNKIWRQLIMVSEGSVECTYSLQMLKHTGIMDFNCTWGMDVYLYTMSVLSLEQVDLLSEESYKMSINQILKLRKVEASVVLVRCALQEDRNRLQPSDMKFLWQRAKHSLLPFLPRGHFSRTQKMNSLQENVHIRRK